ncbi:MAG TPA: BadF/BadG/BcrA/BcrD ATPase family protein [Acidothermaceae bacterium]|nr:BadF/BadG/BcrA/BcrD ATPase family protein [Acidothermaceae bacterium]
MNHSAPPVAVLAIDGGNSKMDVALVADDGRLLACANGPGASAQTVGLPAAVRAIDALVTRAAEAAGLNPRDAGPLARHTAAYLAGVDIPQEQKAMDDALRERNWSLTTTVDNDTFAIFRAGTTSHWGIGIVCGAGINAVGVGPDGQVVRFPALGPISGDFGGGGDLSRHVMWHAVRDEDGRGDATLLRAAVMEHFGAASVTDVVIALHLGEITQAELYELPPVLFRVAAAGDPIAVSLIDRQAEEIALLARATMRRLGLAETPTDVVLGGGVLTARDPLLMERIDAWMSKEAPQAVVRINDVPAIAGAALLGLDHLGINSGAEEVLRAALRVG